MLIGRGVHIKIISKQEQLSPIIAKPFIIIYAKYLVKHGEVMGVGRKGEFKGKELNGNFWHLYK